MNNDSYDAMLEEVQAFHDKHDFKNTGGEELMYRIALMAEELGEISAESPSFSIMASIFSIGSNTSPSSGLISMSDVVAS